MNYSVALASGPSLCNSAWVPDPKTMNIGRWPQVQLACSAWAVTTRELHLGFSGMLPAWALAQPKLSCPDITVMSRGPHLGSLVLGCLLNPGPASPAAAWALDFPGLRTESDDLTRACLSLDEVLPWPLRQVPWFHTLWARPPDLELSP